MLKLVKNRNRLTIFSSWEVQKQKIKITMIYISFENLLTPEWPEDCLIHFLGCDRMFHWGNLMFH